MNALPKMGRPSKTGLSVKELGLNKYWNAYDHQRHGQPRQTVKQWVLDYAQRESVHERTVWRRLKRNPNLIQREHQNQRVVYVVSADRPEVC